VQYVAVRPSTGAFIALIAGLLFGGQPASVAAQSPAGSILTVPIMPTEFRASADRFARLEGWIVATARHTPGRADAYSQELAAWSLTDLQALWVDANALSRVMHDRSVGGFRLGNPDGSSTQIVYTRQQLQRLLALACVAGGYLDPSGVAMQAGTPARDCVETVPLNRLDPAVADVARWFAAERVRRGDDNLFWRRSALLHSDVAMLERPLAVPVGTASLPVGPRRIRIELLDGRRMAVTLGGIHWSMAETLLSFVRPIDAAKPAPERDGMVRSWYQATTMWMQGHEQRDLQHLQAGLDLFPTDATLLFLSGCEHEAYASPAIQVPLEGTPRSVGPVRSPRDELRKAASEFRRSLESGEPAAGALLHLGHVQLLLGEDTDAVTSLSIPDEGLGSHALRYYRDMFLGEAHEQSSSPAEARAAYEHARALFPRAQSPLLALSQLERRTDNYEPAQRAVAALWALDRVTDDDDPWWSYAVSHTVAADAHIEKVWRSVE
jgi:hypothetical protein